MRLPVEKAETVLRLLLEGMSVRSVERVTGVHRDTILRLLAQRAAEAPGFSLDDLLAETPLVEGTERGIRGPFDAIRQRIHVHGDSDMTVKELSAAFPKAARLQ